jgi:membrane peptidoglycan carboxypeptidase
MSTLNAPPIKTVKWWEKYVSDTAIVEVYDPSGSALPFIKKCNYYKITRDASDLAISIGRTPGCDITVNSVYVSASHLKIDVKNVGNRTQPTYEYEVTPYQTRNKTYYKKYWWRQFEELRANTSHRLSHGEILGLGSLDSGYVRIRVSYPASLEERIKRKLVAVQMFFKEKIWSLLKKLIVYVAGFITLLVISYAIWLMLIWSGIPSDISQNAKPNEYIAYRSSSPETIAPLTISRITARDLDDYPPHLRNALLASEDQTFLDNPIIAFFKNQRLIGFSLRGILRRYGGGSTITQQLARNKYSEWVGFDEKKEEKDRFKQLTRKLREVAVAIKMEVEHKKEDILLAYMNSAYLGNGNYGFAEAALDYFSRDFKKLEDIKIKDKKSGSYRFDLAMASALVAMLPAPECYNPNNASTVSYCKSMRIRSLLEGRKLVLQNMVKNGFITSDRAREGEKSLDNIFRVRNVDSNKFALSSTDYGVIYDELETRFLKETIREQNLRIETSIDLDAQKKARQILEDFVKKQGKEKKVSQGALVAIHAQTGKIRAIVTAVEPQQPYEHPRMEVIEDIKDYQVVDNEKMKDKKDDRQYKFIKRKDGKFELTELDDDGKPIIDKDIYNYATQETLSPGSTFKIFPYLAAIKKGYDPIKSISCAPFSWLGEYFYWQRWKSDNNSICRSDNASFNMYNALANSDNLIAVKVSQMAGFDEIESLAKGMGISTKIERNPRLALGASQVKLIEMTSAYAAVANKGQYLIPHTIDYVYNAAGDCEKKYKSIDSCKLHDFNKTQSNREQTLPITKDQAKTMTDLLQNVVTDGTASSSITVANKGFTIAGKTGTSTDAKDLWFIGYITDGNDAYVVGVWLGNPSCSATKCDTRIRTEATSADAAKVWNAFIKAMYPV